MELRVRFVYDEDASFEECNGEARPLTREEYAENSYRGCPDHPRAGSKPDPARLNTGYGLCAQCDRPLADIPYEEYLAYYGNPERHVYLGCTVYKRCACCGESSPVQSLWNIDSMDDSPEFQIVKIGGLYDEQEARALPGYLGEVARELCDEARAETEGTPLDQIAGLLDGKQWDADTLDRIADLVRGAGYAVREYEAES